MQNSDHGAAATGHVRDALARGDAESVRSLLGSKHPHEAARTLTPLDHAELWSVLRLLGTEASASILAHLDPEVQSDLLVGRKPEEIAEFLSGMSADDRVDLLQQIDDEDLRSAVFGLLSPAVQVETKHLAGYEEGTVGSVMSTEFAAIPEGLSAGEAIALLRLGAARKESVHSIYVIDGTNRLIGSVGLDDLVFAAANTSVVSLTTPGVVSVEATAPRSQAAKIIKDYDLSNIPVVDAAGRLIGLVTFDDAIDVEESEATMDFHKMAPIGLMKGGLRQATLARLYAARVPWLLVLVFMNIFSGAGIAYFEDTIEAVVALVFFLPLLIDSGGNAGSQSATLMVRALATGDVKLRDWMSLLGKELLLSLALGFSMAAAVMLISAFRAPEVLVPVGMTMVLTVVFGSCIGMSLPFLLTKFKRDPATASAPLITSIADIGGVLIYFSIASWWLGDAIREAAQGVAG